MRYISLFSGIEAASVAWIPLGWKCAAVAEIEPFPCEVLKHHYPNTPNLGDVTAHDFIQKAQRVGPVDVLVGGAPCQAFSVAGLRRGLEDPRGNLTLTYLAVVDALRPRWIVFENVPGILSSVSHAAPDPCPPPDPLDMECDGQEVDLEDEYDSEELHAFACFLAGLSELGYGYGYGSLDAQYFDLAQRRERVFVVGHLGAWQPAAAVLLDIESLSGHTPPRREPWQRTTGTLSARTEGGGGLGTDFDLDRGAYRTSPNCGAWETGDRIDALTTGTDATSHVLAFSCKDSGADASVVSPTLRAMEFAESHANGGGQVAIAFQERGRKDGVHLEHQEDLAYALTAPKGGGRHQEMNIAESWAVRRLTPIETSRLQGFPDTYCHIPRRPRKIEPDESAHYLSHGIDCWQTVNQWFTKCAADGSIYRAHGNSMAVPCMKHIGENIQMVDDLIRK